MDSVESALAAEAGGAGRIELCDNLVEGGTTPSAGMIAECAARLAVPVFAIIRPRGGDFLYTRSELAVMLRDIRVAADGGAAGVVIGALRSDASIDEEYTADLHDAARPLGVTFHRAFDVCPDPDRALDTLVTLGVDRVLTSGQAATAVEGIPCLRRLVERAAGRIAILAGGGITDETVGRIVQETRVREVHVRGTVAVASAMEWRRPEISLTKPPLPGDVRSVTDVETIRRIVAAVG